MEIDRARSCSRGHPVWVGCAPRERSCCFLLSWKFQLCSGTALRPTPGGEAVRCGNPWTFCGGNPYIQRTWKMVFAISGLHEVRPYSLPLSPFAISIPSLCGKCCCAVSVSRELPCRDGPVQSLDATAGCGARGCALQVVVEPCTAHRVPHGAHVEDARRRGKIIWGKCQANAFCWPSGSCEAGELSWLNWPSGCACLLWPTSTNCCGTLEVPWSSVMGQ